MSLEFGSSRGSYETRRRQMYRVRLKEKQAKQMYIEKVLIYKGKWKYFEDIAFLRNFRQLVDIQQAKTRDDFDATLTSVTILEDKGPVTPPLPLDDTSIELEEDTPPVFDIMEGDGISKVRFAKKEEKEPIVETPEIVPEPIVIIPKEVVAKVDYSKFTVPVLRDMAKSRKDVDQVALKKVTRKDQVIDLLEKADAKQSK